MDGIYVIVNALIHCFDAPGYDHLTLKMFRLILADQCLQLLDQILRLFLRDELGALDGINQQFQLGQFKVSMAEMIINIPAYLLTDDIQSKSLQLFKVTVKSFAFSADIILGKLCDDILCCQ